jgi:hypothetical protein
VKNALVRISVVCVFAFCLAGCGNKSTEPGGGDGGDDYPNPMPGGVLLTGNDGDNAIAAIKTLPPSPAPESEIQEDLLTTRVTVIIDSAATVGGVNDLLESFDARIVSMNRGSWVVTLKVPAVASVADAETLAAKLYAREAFQLALPAFTYTPSPVEAQMGYGSDGILPFSLTQKIEHLIAIRMPAAWNARNLALKNKNNVTVLVPDLYFVGNTHPQIPTQAMLIGGGDYDKRVIDGLRVGNHGFEVCGVIGAAFDASPITGTSPDPENLLEIKSLPIGGLSVQQVLEEISKSVPDPPEKFVLNTSLGFNDSEFKRLPIHSRVVLATFWRYQSAPLSSRMFHAASAGNDGETAGLGGTTMINSSYTMAHYYENIWDMVGGAEITDDQREALSGWWERCVGAVPAAAHPTDNICVVGSSGPDGERTGFSSRGARVRCVGENVHMVCASPDAACDGTVGTGSGTSFASPQVAGLAAYMWNLKPSLSPQEIVRKIEYAYDESESVGLLDAYLAVLSLDSPSNMAVRSAILDVAGDSPVDGTNGKFDENDLQVFLDGFDFYETLRNLGNSDPEYSRFDLNGDGYTGDEGVAKFDLTADVTPSYDSFTVYIEDNAVKFDENKLTDCEILRYYAYSTLYEGDTDRRRELMLRCWKVDLSGLTSILVDADVIATLRKGDGTTVESEILLHTPGDGAVSDGVVTYDINKTYDYGDNTTLVYTGQISGTTNATGSSIETLDVSYTETRTSFGEWQYTTVASFKLTGIPVKHVSESEAWYEIKGNDACLRLSDVSYESTWPGGGWQFTGKTCTDDSYLWVQLVRPPGR